MKKILLGRAGITILFILIELFWILVLINWLSPYIGWVETIIRIFGMVIVFFIINHSTHLSSDLMWIILITALPVPGTIICIFFSAIGEFGNKTFRSIIRETAVSIPYGLMKEVVPEVLIESIEPDLKKAWDLKGSLVDVYRVNTYETAAEALNDLIKHIAAGGVPEMYEFSKTLRSWKTEIINSFIIVKQHHEVDKDTLQAHWSV